MESGPGTVKKPLKARRHWISVRGTEEHCAEKQKVLDGLLP